MMQVLHCSLCAQQIGVCSKYDSMGCHPHTAPMQRWYDSNALPARTAAPACRAALAMRRGQVIQGLDSMMMQLGRLQQHVANACMSFELSVKGTTAACSVAMSDAYLPAFHGHNVDFTSGFFEHDVRRHDLLCPACAASIRLLQDVAQERASHWARPQGLVCG